MAPSSKKQVILFSEIRVILLFFWVVNEYKSTLPDFLLSFVDSIIKVDKAEILRFDFLHYQVDELLREEVQRIKSAVVFIDPNGDNNIILEDITSQGENFPPLSSDSLTRDSWDPITKESFESLTFIANGFHMRYLPKSNLQKVAQNPIVTIDQIRAKCSANLYFQPQQILKDLKGVLAWNQVYRCRSSSSYAYVFGLYTGMIEILNKKNFHQRFHHCKKTDFDKLFSFQSNFKIQTNSWPFIPENFRSYQQLIRYEPALPPRSKIINQKLKTKKIPVECPENCVCFVNNSQKTLCKYSLKDIWISDCPNRANRIQCNHKDADKMQRCMNSEIKKKLRKQCRKDESQASGQDQIEECVMWGVDLYTRYVIFHSLPECDLDFIQPVSNIEYKNHFIQRTFLKAINFNGNEGYDLKKGCQFIISHKQKQTEEQIMEQKEESQGGKKYIWRGTEVLKEKHYREGLFTAKQAIYAEYLLKNYNMFEQKKEAFRIHTKGKGARCINKNGIKEGSFIVEYFGQLYEPWKWYERQDFIKETLKIGKLKSIIPEFYNIYLETHKDDPQGYDLMVVDPISKGNFSSRFSHSCNPNCGTVATISDGKYYIGMYSFRDIQYGEELSFDYCSMTESNYEHTHSICLCGTERCRGYYLSLANSRKYSQILEKSTCFLFRNSLILRALDEVHEEDLARCREYNIKERMLGDSPKWIAKWTSNLLKFMESEAEMYKAELVDSWTRQYPWEDNGQSREDRIQLYSQTYKQQLLSIRFQNLFTTVDKLKYFLNSIEDGQPPLYYLQNQKKVDYLILNKESPFGEIEDVLLKHNMEKESQFLKIVLERINATPDEKEKLFYFRIFCLVLSHQLLFLKATAKFNTTLFSDIVYFYAFTHTYFTAKEYKTHTSEEIMVNLQQITGENKPNQMRKVAKKYSSQFVWGQLVSWYKQTIVSPQSSLSQDRRGTLSFPMIKSTVNSCYPFDKHCRRNFHKSIRDKPASCWPSAPNSGCYLSFRNPFKCYGTMLFENIHNSDVLLELGPKNLIQSSLDVVNSPFAKKLELFKKVQVLLAGTSESFEGYQILKEVEGHLFKFEEQLPEFILKQEVQNEGKPRKKVNGKKDLHHDDEF